MAIIKTSKGDFHFKQRVLFPGIQVINKEKAHDNLVRLKHVLDGYHLSWGLAFGSLLGAVREHDFIEWDEDIDMYILEEEEHIFRDALWTLKDEGFELIRYERRGLYSIRRNGEYIDFYVLSKINDTLRQTKGGGYIFEKYLQDLTEINFRGISLKVPTEYDEFLTFQYGNWREPVRYYNPQMSPVKRLLLIAYCYLRRSLPDGLYHYLIRKNHEKDFERFKAKCKTKGVYLPDDLKLP